MSWLVENDVKQGREVLNFSEWDRPQDKADEMKDVLEEGSMPPLTYRLIHPGARLSPQERDTLLRALDDLLRTNPPPGDGGGGDGSGEGGGE